MPGYPASQGPATTSSWTLNTGTRDNTEELQKSIITQYTGPPDLNNGNPVGSPKKGGKHASESVVVTANIRRRRNWLCCLVGFGGNEGHAGEVEKASRTPEKSSNLVRGFSRGVFLVDENQFKDDSSERERAPSDWKPLLPQQLPADKGKKTLVLDLDETLVHSSFKAVPNADYVIPIDIDGKTLQCYVIKRPWVDYFLESVREMYEVMIFTASLNKYGDPLLDLLDEKPQSMRWRLFRESCVYDCGCYVKDLSLLGRDLKDTIIIDNSPYSYKYQPENAIPISSFIDDPSDRELLRVLKLLEDIKDVPDVIKELSKYRGSM